MTARPGLCCLSLFAFALVAAGSPAESLRAGDSVVLARGGTPIGLLSSSDPIIRFIETAGENAAVRLIIDDASRMISLRASEERTVHLRDVFADSALAKTQLTVEVLQGKGSVAIEATELQPQAATGIRRRAVVPPKPLPTSFALIDQAEAAGTINSETALLYRVYSLFSDARLPAQYRGDDRKVFDSRYMGTVRKRYPTLSPAIQAALQPFLIPPAYQGSWENTKGGSAPSAFGALPPPCQGLGGNWIFVDAQAVPVRVWYRPDVPPDGATANSLALEIDRTIWPTLTGLMAPGGSATGVPLSDDNRPCNGGDGRLDVYVVDEIAVAGLTMPYDGCSNTPAWIEFNRSQERGTAAHEFFHAIQYSYPLTSCEDWDWWSEASAMWSEDFVYHDDQSEQPYALGYLLAPEKPLDFTDSDHEYGAYVLPFFVRWSTGSADFVRTSWQLSASRGALEAVDQAIGGFDQVWPDFAKYNWNVKPWDQYNQWDKLTDGASVRDLTARNDIGSRIYEIDYELPRLSSSYYDFSFANDESSVIFWNGVTSKLAIRDVTQGVLGPQYLNDSADSDAIKGAHVTALIKMDGAWKEEDWTDRHYVTYCRDVLAERIEELVLIISNSEFKNRDRTLKPPGLAPVLYASNMGCWQWRGTATFSGGNATTTANVTWTRDGETSNPFAVHYSAEGTLAYSVSAPPTCTVSGTVSLSGALTSLSTFNFAPTNSPFSRSYVGGGMGPLISLCNASFSFPWLTQPPQPIVPGNPIARFLKVSANGKVMDGTFSLPGPPAPWTWHFDAQREK